MSAVFKEFMPWATVRVEDRDRSKNVARRALAKEQDQILPTDSDDEGMV